MNQTHEAIHLSPKDFKWISRQIFLNECEGKIENLTSWNENENFMSVGIGHFIWYPRDTKKMFTESFPKVIEYMKECGEKIPKCLKDYSSRSCPWNSREEFLADFNSDTMVKLRSFLDKTLTLQVGFIIHNAQQNIERIASTLPASEQQEIIDKFNLIAQAPKGFYLLIDYINFKGSGNNTSERYQGMGWGLLQVLSEMEFPAQPSQTKAAFVAAAVKVLERRVNNSPPERNEERWLPGWKKRLQTYLD